MLHPRSIAAAASWFSSFAALLVALVPSSARAERIDSIVLVPETRFHRSFAAGESICPRSTDLLLAHGFAASGNHSEIVLRAGLRLFEGRPAPPSVPIAIAWQVVPFDLTVSPLVGVEFGGALSRAWPDPFLPGRVTWGWTWSLRALAGVQVGLWRWIALRAFADAEWNQVFTTAPGLSVPGSGWGWGLGLSFRPGVPQHTLVEMLTTGRDFPGDL